MYIRRRGTRVAAMLLAFAALLSMLSGCALVEKVFPPKDEDVMLEEPLDETAGYRQTVLYFQTEDGLMVPVMKLLPWEEGIGRAALSQLVDTETNRISASAMGLKNAVPPGVSFVLSISDASVATVNIIALPDLADAEAEQNLVTAVVNTLTEFPAIEKVQLLFDGKTKKTLSHGTPVKDAMGNLALNMEPVQVAAGGGEQFKLALYFSNQSASLQIPVTRTVSIEPNLTVAMEELLRGPVDTTLRNCFPEGTQVLSAIVEDGVAVINLSKEFAQLQATPDLEQAALESMQLTARHYGDVTTLRVQVEGSDYESASETSAAISVFTNEYR